MKQLTGNEVRQMFLDFFQSKGHMIEPGASLVPHKDPTLLWINSGVAALKKYFDGSETPINNCIANAQKSIRTNDIENVGKTSRHHTFFEMLGNFSIGGYFKEDAIRFAWEFLTSPAWIGFPKEKLYVSVYTDDTEAYRIWTNYVDPTHILKSSDNFWEIGEGPGGPNSEIFYDRGKAYDPNGLGEELFFNEIDNDRYIEVWNIVFSQYDCKPALNRKQYKELPQQNIDTGMGLERLVCLIQNGETNFDTDLFLPIIHATQTHTTCRYEDEQYKMAFRVIADHIRTVTFALADGALFANEGRGYVLRRVLRRAVRFGKKLHIKGSFMYTLIPVVYESMKDFYPYLAQMVTHIANLVKAEEERFHATLTGGEHLLMEVMKHNADSKVIDGRTAFKLYDTYGFPLELTVEMAKDSGYDVDVAVFEEEMETQRQRARNAREDAQSMASQSADILAFTKDSTFVGYENVTCDARVIAIFKDGVYKDCMSDVGDVIFDKSVFYAESGGQVGDSGYFCGDKIEGRIHNTKKAPHAQHLHKVELLQGTLCVGDCVNLQIDMQRRKKITSNHSCTHLLQSALKKVVGGHIQQAGSFVNEDYLRFDFTHFEKVNQAQINEIEELVNMYIAQNHTVLKEEMQLEAAKQSGATALFDEKYGDVVRVVSMGDVSKEFCGGCHVQNTQEIGVCKLVSEESIGSGIRRIIAKTGFSAYADFAQEDRILQSISEHLKLKGIQHVESKVIQLFEEALQQKKELAKYQEEMLLVKAKHLMAQGKKVNERFTLIYQMDGMDAIALKDIAKSITSQKENAVVFLASIHKGNVNFVASADTIAVSNGIVCGELVKKAAIICGGKGGGRPDLAQSGGKDTSKIKESITFIENMLL